LRTETLEHLEFLRALYATTRQDEMRRVPWTDEQKESFLSSQFDAQHAYYRGRFPDASYLVIFIDGAPAGRLYVHRRADEIELVDVALLPRHRGTGIGGALVRDLQDEAARSGLPLRLYVEHENPAKRLYDRLGFRVLRDIGLYFQMEWRAEWRTGDLDVS
jgi:ribosomal protein S18 acetylase RimI-like enzyme